MALTQASIGKPRCEIAGCECDASQPVYIQQRCHRGAGVVVSYLNGVLTVQCLRCRSLVSEFEVAKGDK